MTVGLESNPPGELYCPTCEKTYVVGERCPDDGTRLVKLTTTHDALIGRDLGGNYTIVEKLGQGGMGTVYRGTQHSVGREVAIKVVTPSLVSAPLAIKRFLREAKLASRLSHPNAVSVLDFGQTPDGLFYLVMELVNGRTLEQVLETEHALPPARIVRIGAQICDALEGAEELQIVHRDLKPANVMLLAKGRDLVKVLDFGLAKSLSPDASTATMTNAGQLLGTPAFMPPELVTGGTADARSDLYSLGCILYVMATGRQPFVADSIHELIAMHASDPVPPLVNVPPRLAAVINRLLEKDPARRYRGAAAAREALEATLGTDAIEAPPDPTLVAGSRTVLGWSGDTSQPGKLKSDKMAPLVRHDTEPDDADLRSQSMTLIAPDGIVPVMPRADEVNTAKDLSKELAPLHGRTAIVARPSRMRPLLVVGAIIVVAATALGMYVLLT